MSFRFHNEFVAFISRLRATASFCQVAFEFLLKSRRHLLLIWAKQSTWDPAITAIGIPEVGARRRADFW